ncbi:MAG: hypothetical protein ACTHU0_11455 [Kofleriaceae bacterium]
MRSCWLVIAMAWLVGCGDVVKSTPDGAAPGDAVEASLESVVVGPAGVVRVGETYALTATAKYDDGTKVDVTARAAWSAMSVDGTATVAGGVVTGVSKGKIRISAELDGTSGSIELDVRGSALLVVSNFDSRNLAVYPWWASGDVGPSRAIVGASTGLIQPRGLAVVNDEIIAVDQGSNSVNVFAFDASGDVSPLRRLLGGDTRLAAPVSALVSGNELYVVQFGSVLVFPLTANGNVAPTRVLTEVAGAQYAVMHDGELYVTNRDSATISVFGSGPTVVRSIGGSQTGLFRPSGIAIRGDELIVADSGTNELRVFPVTASGDVAPLRVVRGGRTELASPDQLAVLGSELFVGNYGSDSVLVFPISAAGDVAPLRSIAGLSTGFAGTVGVAIY